MRDLLVTAIVFGALPFALRHAWVGVLLWTWLSIMNPHRLGWGFAHTMPFAAMAAAATLVALFTGRDRVRLPASPAVVVLVAFIVWMGLTTAFAIHPGDSLESLEQVIKIQLMTLVALAVLHERLHIQAFVWVNAVSLGFFGFKGGLFTLRTGGSGKVWGPGGFIGGNNEVGLAILVTIPLLYYLYRTTGNRLVRKGLLAVMLLSAVAVLGTHSRGAFLAIAVMSVLLWWRSAGQKLVSGFMIVLAAAVLLPMMPDAWHERMGTIQTYEEDGSAMGRINAWETAINIANDRPAGAGFAMYEQSVFDRYAPRPAEERATDPSIVRAAHSIYFQVLGEHGWIGLGLFLSIWLLVWRDAAWLRRRTRGDPEFEWVFHLASMCQVALVGYAVGGAFLSLAYFDLPYNLLVIAVVTRRWLEGRLAARRAAGTAAGEAGAQAGGEAAGAAGRGDAAALPPPGAVPGGAP